MLILILIFNGKVYEFPLRDPVCIRGISILWPMAFTSGNGGRLLLRNYPSGYGPISFTTMKLCLLAITMVKCLPKLGKGARIWRDPNSHLRWAHTVTLIGPGPEQADPGSIIPKCDETAMVAMEVHFQLGTHIPAFWGCFTNVIAIKVCSTPTSNWDHWCHFQGGLLWTMNWLRIAR